MGMQHLVLFLFEGRVFSVRASLPIEAMVIEQDPRAPRAPAEHREGPAFGAMFPCAAPRAAVASPTLTLDGCHSSRGRRSSSGSPRTSKVGEARSHRPSGVRGVRRSGWLV